jgi:oligoribonuclease NrnB/cAMP/cGMP phosphodiesterase (DHH superfamily)
MKCYYHKIDLDGKCSAAIVKRKYPDCDMIGVDYPDRPDFEAIIKDKVDCVIIVDFSFEPEDMQALMDYTDGNVLWIDHHKSAIEKIDQTMLPESTTRLSKCIAGKREIGKAGCELTWEYLFPDEPMPEAVRLLGRYDVWDKSDNEAWEKEILPFQMGMRLEEWEVNSVNTAWERLLGNDPGLWHHVSNICKDGLTVLKYEEQRNGIYSDEMAFHVEFEGHKGWAINKALSSSKIFEEFYAHDRPLWILFNYNAGTWKYTLYSSNNRIDVSKIAVKHGGGGHAGAAGFKSDKYLLKDIK